VCPDPWAWNDDTIVFAILQAIVFAILQITMFAILQFI
jgi:hypothetical protein